MIIITIRLKNNKTMLTFLRGQKLRESKKICGKWYTFARALIKIQA